MPRGHDPAPIDLYRIDVRTGHDAAAGRGIAVLVHEATPRRRLEIRTAGAALLEYWRQFRRWYRR